MPYPVHKLRVVHRFGAIAQASSDKRGEFRFREDRAEARAEAVGHFVQLSHGPDMSEVLEKMHGLVQPQVRVVELVRL